MYYEGASRLSSYFASCLRVYRNYLTREAYACISAIARIIENRAF